MNGKGLKSELAFTSNRDINSKQTKKAIKKKNV